LQSILYLSKSEKKRLISFLTEKVSDAHYPFLFERNAQIKTKIHNAIVQPPKRFTKKIKKVAVEFLPDAIIVGKK
jgi:hypothetical protein